MKLVRLFVFFLLISGIYCLSKSFAAFPVKSNKINMAANTGTNGFSTFRQIVTTERNRGIFHFPHRSPLLPNKKQAPDIAGYGIGSLICGVAAYVSAAVVEVLFVISSVLGGPAASFVALAGAGLCLSIAAIVLGAIGMGRKYRLKGLAIAGFVLGILTIFPALGLLVLALA